MDKWEQVARDHMGIPPTVNYPGVGKLADLLRQCEADTIRRCTCACDEAVFDADLWPCGEDAAVGRKVAGDVKDAILALLPKEVGE